MKNSPRKLTAFLLALIMTLSMMPLEAFASVFTTYEEDVVVNTSGAVQISDTLVASEVTTRDGYSVVVTSIDEILPADGWVVFSDESSSAQASDPEAKEHRPSTMMAASRNARNFFIENHSFYFFPASAE